MIVDASSLRPTLRRVTAGDEPFLRALYASTRERELSIVPWPEEQKTAFLTMQFDAQDSHYRTHYPDAQFDIIEIDGVAAGRFYVWATARELRAPIRSRGHTGCLPALRQRNLIRVRQRCRQWSNGSLDRAFSCNRDDPGRNPEGQRRNQQ